MEDTFAVPLDKSAQLAGMVFLQGLDAIGAAQRRDDPAWFSKRGWEAVALGLNDLQDGEYQVKDIAAGARTNYLLAAGIPEAPEVLPGEMVVWEAVVRAMAALIEEGEMTPAHNAGVWAEWVENKLRAEGFTK